MFIPGQAIDVTLEDVAGKAVALSSLRGRPAILVYAGRRGSDAAIVVGKALQSRFGSEAATPVANVVPVACLAEVPRFLRGMARTQVKQAAEGVPILIDFDSGLQRSLGMDEAAANVAVIDATGHLVGITSGGGETCVDCVAALVHRLQA